MAICLSYLEIDIVSISLAILQKITNGGEFFHWAT